MGMAYHPVYHPFQFPLPWHAPPPLVPQKNDTLDLPKSTLAFLET